MRRRLFDVIEVSKGGDIASTAYDIVMMFSIVISIIPLAFKNSNRFFGYVDIVTTALFIFDYLLRLSTADYKLGKGHVLSFILYPFTPLAIIDLISILPGISMLSNGFRLFRLFRIFRTFRVFRVFKAFRYSKNIIIVLNVIKSSKEALLAVCTLAVFYILISALIVFNVESASFDSFFDALYWATVSLTTVGYGDIYPVTDAGRFITMLSSVFGIAVVALPSGIITAGYLDALAPPLDVNEKGQAVLDAPASPDPALQPAAALTEREAEHLRRYRYIDEEGRKWVDATLDREYDRCAAEKGNASIA